MKNFLLYVAGFAIIVIPFIAILIITKTLIFNRKKNKSLKENKE
jgi:hypothetical protein